MKIFYDTEFLEDGERIELISIGMVKDNGDELYAINRQMPLRGVADHPWLPNNVVPHLPLRWSNGLTRPALMFDRDHPDYQHVYMRSQIRDMVREFVLKDADPELWGWFSAYDHVVLAQLFGTMAQLPSGFPQLTSDVAQEAVRVGVLEHHLPVQERGTEHHALADARWTRDLYRAIMARDVSAH